jgi:hypothetical protein
MANLMAAKTNLALASVGAAVGLFACSGSAAEPPVPFDPSWKSRLARGAVAPDVEGLQSAVIRYVLDKWPRQARIKGPEVSTVCLTILPPNVEAKSGDGDLPFQVRRLLYDPRAKSAGRAPIGKVQIVDGSTCFDRHVASELMSLEIGWTTRWAGTDEYEVVATIVRDFAWDARKLLLTHSDTGWAVVGCEPAGEVIAGFPSSCDET